MAENLPDNALQCVPAARFDLEDVRQTAGRAAFDRLDEALTESAQKATSQVDALTG